MGNCYDCFSPQPEVETPDPVSEKRVILQRFVAWFILTLS